MVGAGPSFGQPAVDERARVVYLATSQPSPDWNATYRPGPNLYSDSIVALNVTNGRMIWYYQSTPHDLWDFDCGWNVVLGRVAMNSVYRTAVFKACKNGYVYALDATTGSLLWYIDPPSVRRAGTGNANFVATGVYNATQHWINYPSTSVFEQCPGANGAVESDMAYAYGLLYVATYNLCAYVVVASVNTRGANQWGVKQLVPAFSQANTTIYAVNASSGQAVWSFFLPKIGYRGWLSVSNGVVYAGALDGYIHALDSKTGKQIATLNVGQSLYESPTIGSTRNGDTLLLQSTSPPSYGVFSTNETGFLIAYGLRQSQGQILEYAFYGALGGAAALTTFFLTYVVRRTRVSRRETGPG
jgi:alcohol dehydrogenase (cytochrome c)